MRQTADAPPQRAGVRADLIWQRLQRRPLIGRRLVPRVAALVRTWTTGDRVAAVALVALAMAIALFRLADMSVWGDEAFSIGLASLSWSELWRYAWTTEVHMVPYHAFPTACLLLPSRSR